MNGYQHLANAIIVTAYSDYRTVLKDLKKYPRNEDRLQEIKILERFFCSVWYEMLTTINAEYITNKIKEEVWNGCQGNVESSNKI